MSPGDGGCELCEAARITAWHHEDDTCWVADCEVCGVPMVVWKQHGNAPPEPDVEHMLAELGTVADRVLGAGTWSYDRVMRQIPDHFHAHARDPGLVVTPFRAVLTAVIKYLGSKRRLVPALAAMAAASGAKTALDLFCGTTRVSQAFKGLGMEVTAVDTTRYAHVLARCYVATDPDAHPGFRAEVADAVDRLNAVPGRAGYVTETFCSEARFFRPANGARIDAVREAIEDEYVGSPLWPVLLTSLLEAADRVDSTTGLQMAYLKQWAPRADLPLTLRVPVLVPGSGLAVRGDACQLAGGPDLPAVDLAYLDPPYNQHRYDANYHVWETLVARDSPDHYGVACKRSELRDPGNRSPFNSRRTMPAALADVVDRVDAGIVALSYNNEGWLTFDQLHAMCGARGHVEVLAFDSARYVGARIGIHDPAGKRVGAVSHVRNTEYVVLCGPRPRVRAMAAAVESAGLGARVDRPVPLPAA